MKIIFGSLFLFTVLSAAVTLQAAPLPANWKDLIPHPVYEADSALVKLYHETWNGIAQRVKKRSGLVQNPYLDVGYDSDLLRAQDICTAVMYTKYAYDVFPGAESLRNYYLPVHDQIPTPVSILTVDNPQLFAWAEYQDALFRGDRKILEKRLLKEQYLQRQYELFDSLDTPALLPGLGTLSIPTVLRKHDLGYFWTPLHAGMEKTPRGRFGTNADTNFVQNPEMLWVDAISQQAFSAYCISKMASILGQKEMSNAWLARWRGAQDRLNAYYWDSEDGLYYDINCFTLAPLKVVTPACFWPMLARVPNRVQAARMVEFIQSPDKLGGSAPWVTLARDDADFNPEKSAPWRGELRIAAAYTGIKALESYGYLDMARSNALSVLKRMEETFQKVEPHTLYESYAPDSALPAEHREGYFAASPLGPISLFLENVIGIYEVNAFENTVRWHVPEQESEIGMRNLRFGKIVTDLLCEKGKVRVKSNAPYRLFINGIPFSIKPGDNFISL